MGNNNNNNNYTTSLPRPLPPPPRFAPLRLSLPLPRISSGEESRIMHTLSDVRMLFLRIAFRQSLSADCYGGSVSSNLKLVVPLLSIVLHYTALNVPSDTSTNNQKRLTSTPFRLRAMLRRES